MALPYATVPPLGYGPGSQPDGEDGLAYMPMPSGMRTYEAHLPEIEDAERALPAIAFLKAIQEALARAEPGETTALPLEGLEAGARALVAETLGEGEVSVLVQTPGGRIEIQEATLAGVWRVRGGAAQPDRERIEIAAFPRGALIRAFPREWPVDVDGTARLPGVVNAPAILAEIVHKSRERRTDELPHVINLTLLPVTPEDIVALESRLGQGGVVILSRGYGNCRIEATALRDVWRVRYFNSSDTLILDTIEIVDVPAVACAAPEDLADSAARLVDILETVG
ncbi:hydrogenase expression/formation protein [Ancylobacter vacuolatus]|uniref:Hydrogenase-1 operon protein HyaF n=1 Tax=Ancylobacter vacuolatus TaxID=223389 RepID=A0ABU0DJY0_9HYPH|nr:hydrogenase expression/formation protein [Ancylobacter vacuolatus]MDQ0348732.1 hydrogenase-1 operon protein HyaF [Ancylobacter vacuolatus]